MNKMLLLFLCGGVLFADRGIIPFDSGVRIFEPNQKAFIAWNGKEEILLLTTDVKAEKKTEVLEVLPLPSKPEVKKGDTEIFNRCVWLINKRMRKRMLMKKGVTSVPKAAGELVFYKKIGVHDISVIHVLNKRGFIQWVEEYLESKKVKNPKIPEKIKKIVEEYLRENFKWFVFDVVSLDEKLKSVEPIEYRFKTESLYFPLKITRNIQGYTKIDLLVLSPTLLKKFPKYPIHKIKLRHLPITLTSNEIRYISEEIYRFLNVENAKLRIWRIEGKLSEFKDDLIAK